MPQKNSIAFLNYFSHVLLGINAFALGTTALSFILGYGTPEQRWEWLWHSGLSMLVLLLLMVRLRQYERSGCEPPES
jgi:hypothetical protein